MSENNHQPEQDELKNAFRELGNNLHKMLKNTWESEERQQIQKEIEDGITELGTSFREAIDDFQQSDTGKQLKDNVEDLNQRIKSGELEQKVRTEIHKVINTINSELKQNFNSNPEEKTDE